MPDWNKLNLISDRILGAAIEVHRHLGAGLLESAYEACLAYELTLRGLHVEQQKPLPLYYKEVHLEVGYRIDLLIEDAVIVEVKSVEQLAPVHEAQLLSYLKLSGKHLGLLINFNVSVLRDGVKRMVL